ncbi:MAG: alpha-hydroxy acid oxidase [Actinomycetota bacterium]
MADSAYPVGSSIDLKALEQEARDALPGTVYDFFAGGADDEFTLRENETSWGAVQLRPRVLRGVGSAQTRTTVLGASVSGPILVAPVAFQRLAHPDGEAATARGAAAAGTVFVASTRTTVSPEDIATAAAGAPLWFQVYILRDRGWTAELVGRAAEARYRGLVLTVDAPILGRRLRDERNMFRLPENVLADNLRSALGVDPASLHDPSAIEHDPELRLEDIGWLRSIADLPVVVKGVLRGDDAVASIEAGASAIVVSNHGGRQLDTVVPTARALPEVVDAVAGRAEVYADGGIRRGTDVLKALALGARAVMLGRPVVWALATGGAEGVYQLLEGMRTELARAMTLCQLATPEEVSRDLVGAAGRPSRWRRRVI